MQYRRVEMLQLHSAGVVVTPFDYSDGVTGWMEWPYIAECWRLDGRALEKLAHHLGLETWPIDEDVPVKGGKKRYRTTLRELDLQVYREIPHSGQGFDFTPGNETHKIDWLEVEVPVQPGFLNIRVCMTWDEAGEKQTHISELTYSGNYTIWWEYDAR